MACSFHLQATTCNCKAVFGCVDDFPSSTEPFYVQAAERSKLLAVQWAATVL